MLLGGESGELAAHCDESLMERDEFDRKNGK
jgi:hypothetical protein